MTQMDEMHIYEKLNHWIWRIDDRFGQSMKDLAMMIEIIRTDATNAIRVDQGVMDWTIVMIVRI